MDYNLESECDAQKYMCCNKPRYILKFHQIHVGIPQKAKFLVVFFLLHAASEMYLCIILCIVFLDMAHPNFLAHIHVLMILYSSTTGNDQG